MFNDEDIFWMEDKEAVNIPALIKRLRELESKATPGPWEGWDIGVEIGDTGIHEIETNNPMVGDNSADTHFIAESRNALPQLLEFCDEAIELLDKVKKELSE